MSDEDIEEKVRELSEKLPDWMPKEGSNNEDILSPPADEIVNLERDVEDAFEASTLQLAPTEDLIDAIAEMVGVEQTTDSRDVFRAKSMLGFALNTSQGTTPQVLEEMAALLDVDIEEVMYEELDESGVDRFLVPRSSIDAKEIDGEEFTDIFRRFVAAGYNIEIILRGTFEHRSLQEYNLDVERPERGYNTLDEDGSIETVGGVYTTLIITEDD